MLLYQKEINGEGKMEEGTVHIWECPRILLTKSTEMNATSSGNIRKESD